MYKIKQFSNLVDVSIRMLRHYDKIGLLIPEHVNKHNGYRYYGDENLATMQQILFFKELDFSLAEIKSLINGAFFNQYDALCIQRNLLHIKKQRLSKLVGFIDELLLQRYTGANEMNKKLKHAMNNHKFESKKTKYLEEAKKKWGETDRFKQSQRRLAQYSQDDLEKINAKQELIYKELVELMPLGINNQKVQNQINVARMLINDHWYKCDKQQFAALGQMYVSDHRFKEKIDQYGPGLAEFINQAIAVYVADD